MKTPNHSCREESGFVLIVSLIMLIVMTLVGVSVIRISTTNLQLVNNMQARQQAIAAASSVINQVLSSSFINEVDINGALTTVASTAYTYSPDGTGTGARSYSVTIAKPCLRSMTQLRNAEIPALVATNSAYSTCLGAGTYATCFRSVWEVTADVSSGFLGAKTSITQGAEIILNFATAINSASVTTAYLCTN
jgi:Tfp pilus assembly protein PilX